MELEASGVDNLKQVYDVGSRKLKKQRSCKRSTNPSRVGRTLKRQRSCRCCSFQYTSDVDNMKQVCNVRRWTVKKQRSFRRSTNPSLPHEVIEIILSGLPLKDLLRFKVVCKQWEATISDPVFAEIHLQRHKKILLALECRDNDYIGLHVFELQDNYCIEFVSAIEEPYCVRGTTVCSCDGLYLRRTNKGQFVLWNPSCRTYRELYGPQSVLESIRTIHGMYYDPLMKDYKIVIADMKHYAVYSCRDNKWGDTKEMIGFLGEYYPQAGVSFNGSIYWLAVTFLDPKRNYQKFSEVICFDCMNEDFKRLPLPYIKNLEYKNFQLTSFSGHLCLLIVKPGLYSYSKIKIMKKVNSSDEWMESKEECLCNFRPMMSPTHLCVLSENKILLEVLRPCEDADYMVYDKSKNTLVKTSGNHPPSCNWYPFIHRQNLFML